MFRVLTAEFLVKYGLPIILFLIFLSLLVSIIVIKFVLKQKFLNYATEILVENFYGDLYEIVRRSSGNGSKRQIELADEKHFINIDCYNIKIDATSRFIQIPYIIRFVSLILFWGYFCIQILCLKEIFTDTDQTDHEAGLVCFNVSSRIVGHYYRCEKYGLISLEDILDNMDQIAGILTLNEINRYVFKFAYRFFRWLLRLNMFKTYYRQLKAISDPADRNAIPRVSYAQVNYLVLMAYLSFSIYENFTRDNHFVPVKFVCYSTLVYSTVLCAYETVKYSIVVNDEIGHNLHLVLSRAEKYDDYENLDSRTSVNDDHNDPREQLIKA